MRSVNSKYALHLAQVQNNEFYSIRSDKGWLHQSGTCWTDVDEWAWRGNGSQLNALCQKHDINLTHAQIIDVTDKVIDAAGKSPSKMPAPDNRRRVAVMR